MSQYVPEEVDDDFVFDLICTTCSYMDPGELKDDISSMISDDRSDRLSRWNWYIFLAMADPVCNRMFHCDRCGVLKVHEHGDDECVTCSVMLS